ncbi:MAG: pyruvate:ferredoxin (flavodoxin) oxidoreductase [Phycisphaeraceae bacterium]|nr:pyruvate:ferredoxin (flavodoxin) oxidoreductase [Phycisphaeraceae bacterium]
MKNVTMMTVDGNEAVASVAHRTNEVIAIYPITPSSPMGEFADEWAAKGKKNIWGQIPRIQQMQSEGGAVGAVHGALQAGALTTTFTASQGLLLMIPNMYKIAGELTPFCMHVAARALATHALSIFGDHSDVMACRQTGFAMLCSNGVQEAHDFALIAQAATLQSRVPFIHFFDGFRTSHEVAKIAELDDEDIKAMMDDDLIAAHRRRALTPDKPVLRGTAQNPDVYFQAREACNPFDLACPDIVKQEMEKFAQITGRSYQLYEYVGDPQADRVIVMMGSACDTAHETVDYLNKAGQKVGLLKVRLYRPLAVKDFVAALPRTCKSIAVLDRTKEPGAPGEPLYLDTVAALRQAAKNGWRADAQSIRVIGGRYGLSSKEFTPAMVKAVFDELTRDDMRDGFTVGIIDDVTHTSLPVDHSFDIEGKNVVRAVFFGLGADGTVGANKNSIKIIGEETPNYAQGYFVYDSKKSGAMTTSHLRFGPQPIRSIYLVSKANFVACHQFNFMEKQNILDIAADGAVFLLNAPFPADQVWDNLPSDTQRQIIGKKLRCYVIDANTVAQEQGMGNRINTVMQACFFAISGVLPREEAIDQIKKSIKKTYGKKGDEIVKRNFAAVDASLAHLHELKIPDKVTAKHGLPQLVAEEAPTFVKEVEAVMMAGKGDILPVSVFTPDGTWPTATCQWEKRNIALEIPLWDKSVCIQCNKCALVCPHAAIRSKVYDPASLAGAPSSFESCDYKAPDFRGSKFTIQVAPEDCTGCGLCVSVCPAKNKQDPKRKAINMVTQRDHRDAQRENYAFFLNLPDPDRTKIARIDVKGSQFFRPLFEYSGACAGCGETPYVKLLSQLFGDRLMIANATGCSSIYGGNLPTTPYCVDKNGRGPTWNNSLFEDNAEFGLGFRLALTAHTDQAAALLRKLAPRVGDKLVGEILAADQSNEAGINAQRDRIVVLRKTLKTIDGVEPRRLDVLADYLVKKSVWILGGDGWAYDIGYGGLDHVLSLQHDINILVMDTEVYSNTGGQSSKATPIGAAAKFAAAGKEINKKDLGLMAMSYGHVYVASVSMGAKDNLTVQAFLEAEAYQGPSILIAYSHCIAHGYDLIYGLEQQKKAVDSGIWPLYRFDPRRIDQGQPPLQLDNKEMKLPVSEYMKNETRFRMIEKQDPARFKKLAQSAQDYAARRMSLYQQLASLTRHAGGNGHGEQTSQTN